MEMMTDSEEIDIPALPQEAVEYILSCLDGRTLGCAEQVCVKWNRLCKLKKAKRWWKSCCEKEIPKSALCDILSKKYPMYVVQGSKDFVDWKYVYKRWFQWSQIHSYSVLLHVIPVNTFKTWSNVMKTSGYWLFLTSHHLVFVYHVESSYHQIIYKTNLHIIDIDLKVDVRCNTGTSCDPEWLPDSAKLAVKNYEFLHKYLIVNMVDSQSVEIDLQTKEKKWQRYIQRSSGGKTVRVHSAARSTSISVVDDMTSNVITEFTEVLYDSYDILDFCNTMLLLKNNRSPYDVCSVDINTQKVTRIEESLTLDISYSWRCNVLVGIKAAFRSDVWLLMNGKKTVFNPFVEIQTTVTSVLFYNNNLILGTDSGYVYIYEVTGINGLLSLDLRSHKLKHRCSDEAITCIEVMDKADYPWLVLFSGQVLIMLKFIKI